MFQQRLSEFMHQLRSVGHSSAEHSSNPQSSGIQEAQSTVVLEDHHIPYVISYSGRKHARLDMADGILKVTLPLKRKITFEQVLKSKSRWIIRKYLLVKSVQELESIKSGKALLFGEEIAAEELRSLFLSGAVHSRLAERIAFAVAQYQKAVGAKPNRIRIRSMRTKWASCSGTGSLCFNLRMAVLPQQLINCIVAHEMAHLKVKNHGKGFYVLLSSLVPDHKAKEPELKKFWHISNHFLRLACQKTC